MEPLSLTASIIAIIEISKTIASICVAYISNYQDAPKDLRNIIIEVGAIKCVVEVIRLEFSFIQLRWVLMTLTCGCVANSRTI
jgi:hypothetical protein